MVASNLNKFVVVLTIEALFELKLEVSHM